MIRPLVIGNWKMHGDGASLATIAAIADAAAATPAVEVALCVPATLLHRAAMLRPALTIGGQDCHRAVAGAHTGAVSAVMLREAGAQLVIVGHSERRAAGDDDAAVAAKVAAAWAAGLRAILCVGESAAGRAGGEAVAATCRQLRASLPAGGGDLAIAYEPVWAIGSGRLPAPAEIAPVIAGLRAVLAERGGERTPVLYGGSVTAAAVTTLLAGGGADGLLVGQASLDAVAFAAIVSRTAAAPAAHGRRPGSRSPG